MQSCFREVFFWQICQICVMVQELSVVVIRPNGLQCFEVDIEFNNLLYSKIEIDLQHINRGKKREL
jgi:hypothetical protein